MTLKLGTKEIAVDSIFKVVVTGAYTATIHFIFGNAIIVRCRASEFVDEPTYRSRFHFHGTPAELYRLVQRLKRKAWLRRERKNEK